VSARQARGHVPDMQARRIDWDPQGSINHAVPTLTRLRVS